jgi:hypothetical protein
MVHDWVEGCFFIEKNEILNANKDSNSMEPKIRSYAAADGKN